MHNSTALDLALTTYYLLLTYLVGVVAIHFSIDHYPAERGGWTEEHDTFEKWG